MEYAAGRIPHLRLARVTAEEELKGTPGVHFVGFVPAGTRLRFKKLWLDNGEGGLLWMTASLTNDKYRGKMVYVDESLLERNIFLHDGPSRKWAVKPNFLKRADTPRETQGGQK